jgi:hypothetical protein
MIAAGVESELAERSKNQLHSNSKDFSTCQLQLHSEHDYILSQLYSNSAVGPRKRDPTLLQLQTKQLPTPESTPTPDRSCPSLRRSDVSSSLLMFFSFWSLFHRGSDQRIESSIDSDVEIIRSSRTRLCHWAEEIQCRRNDSSSYPYAFFCFSGHCVVVEVTDGSNRRVISPICSAFSFTRRGRWF